jgi:hypothetical protein
VLFLDTDLPLAVLTMLGTLTSIFSCSTFPAFSWEFVSISHLTPRFFLVTSQLQCGTDLDSFRETVSAVYVNTSVETASALGFSSTGTSFPQNLALFIVQIAWFDRS